MTDAIQDAERTLDQSATLTGVVKWFDPFRGFGFVLVSGFEDEFLLHLNVLRDFGKENAADGATIQFKYAKQENGLRVVEILSLTGTVRSIEYEDLVHPDRVAKEFVPARVKWFERTKGYGFVNCYGSPEDVFIGSDILKRNGLKELNLGQALDVRICEARGRKRVYEIRDWPTKLPSFRSKTPILRVIGQNG